MKFSKESLRQLISEEIEVFLNEQGGRDPFVDPVEAAVWDDLVIQGIKNKEKLAAKYGGVTSDAPTPAVGVEPTDEWDQGDEDEAFTGVFPFVSDEPGETQDDPLLAGMLKHGIPNSSGVRATLQLGLGAIETPADSATSEFVKSVGGHPPSIQQKIKNYFKDLFGERA